MALMATGATFRLFVYGTLKRGGVRHFVLADQRYLGPARTLPRYALYDLGAYPALVRADDGQAIEGELYEVAGSLRGELDRVEGAPGWFDLAPIDLEGQDVPVFAYFYQRAPAGGRLTAGRWDNDPVREAGDDD